MGKRKKKNIGFALIKLNLEQFAIIEDAFQEEAEVGLETGLRFGFQAQEKRIKCSVHIAFKADDHPFLILAASNEYEVQSGSWDECKVPDEQRLLFPKEFMAHLAMLTVGTARGMLHVKTENTGFNRFFLPTINVSEIIAEDVECGL
jgi:hypothetical protein